LIEQTVALVANVITGAILGLFGKRVRYNRLF
jgi:hypothetical protein